MDTWGLAQAWLWTYLLGDIYLLVCFLHGKT